MTARLRRRSFKNISLSREYFNNYGINYLINVDSHTHDRKLHLANGCDAHKEEPGSINLDREILSRDFAQLISGQATLHNNSLIKTGFSNLLCAKRRDGKFGKASLNRVERPTRYCANLDDASRENCVFQPDLTERQQVHCTALTTRSGQVVQVHANYPREEKVEK